MLEQQRDQLVNTGFTVENMKIQQDQVPWLTDQGCREGQCTCQAGNNMRQFEETYSCAASVSFRQVCMYVRVVRGVQLLWTSEEQLCKAELNAQTMLAMKEAQETAAQTQ